MEGKRARLLVFLLAPWSLRTHPDRQWMFLLLGDTSLPRGRWKVVREPAPSCSSPGDLKVPFARHRHCGSSAGGGCHVH